MTLEPVEKHNHFLARKACLASLERRIERKQAQVHRLRHSHGRSAAVLSELSQMRSRELFLSTGGDPFMRVYTGPISAGRR